MINRCLNGFEELGMSQTPYDASTNLITPINFSIGALFRESWQRVKGFKATFWGAFFLSFIASVVIAGVLACIGMYLVSGLGMDKENVNFVTGILQAVLTMPIGVGLMLIGIKRARDLPNKAMDVFNYYGYFFGLAGIYFVEIIILTGPIVIMTWLTNWSDSDVLNIITSIGCFLYALFAIYLSVAYTFAMPLLVEKNLSIWQSLELSRKRVTKHWFKVFFILLILVLFVLVAVLPILLGLIWVMPFATIVCGAMYVKLFDNQSTVL
jgi:membrane-anchored glycerophosphoryl diester phosphodiesterase (GDPDase)